MGYAKITVFATVKTRRLSSSQTVDGSLDLHRSLGAFCCDHNGVVAGNGAERSTQAGFVKGRGDAGSTAGERLHDNEIASDVHLFNQFGNHALKTHFLGKDIVTLARLHETHVHDIAGNSSLSALVAGRLQLISEIALRLDIAIANDVANHIMSLLPFPQASLLPAPGGALYPVSSNDS